MSRTKKKNTGKQYEELIEYVYKQLSDFSGKQITVERNIKIKGKSGALHQIDVYYQFEINGIIHKVVIECKDHKQKVEKTMIQSFKGVIDDIGSCSGIFASRNGFQSGAMEYAKYYDIELITGGEVPLLSKVITEKIGILLPDERVIGQPFWTLMEERNGKITGTYICVSNETIGLFISKKCAEEVAQKIGGAVRGVSQRHLKVIIGYARSFDVDISIILFDTNKGLLVEAKVIEDYFII